MKKILSAVLFGLLLLSGTTPAKAEANYFNDWQWWPYTHTDSASIAYSGSLKQGEYYTVSVSGSTPNSETCNVQLKLLDSGFNTIISSANQISGNFSIASNPLVAGAATTWENFGTILYCGPNIYITSFMSTIFESPLPAPVNFSVFPQAGGTAFTTWGIANGATSYTVTAAPSGRSCTTSFNYCTITGLTTGETYTFTLTASNGTATSSVTSGPILERQPVSVAVALNGGTWKVGETVNAQVSIQGQGTPVITWYRCDQAVPAVPGLPVGGASCSQLSSGTSTSYTLSSADLGKFITANVFVNFTDPQGQMTASNNNPVLAAGAVAPAPVADPDGKPTITNIPDRIVPVAGGTQITISGTGLSGVTSVTVGGQPAVVISKTDTAITIEIPVASNIGTADLVITNSKGSASEKAALVYTTAPVTKVTKTKTVTGFSATQRTLTTAQKSVVKSLIVANPTLTQLTCAAKTTGVAVSAAELAKAKALAKATCAYASTVKKTLLVGISANQSLPKSKASRNVLLTLKN